MTPGSGSRNAHGCEIATGSCRVRYDTELFYGSPATPKPKLNSRQRASTQSSNSLPPSPSTSPLPPPSDSSPQTNGASNTTSGKKHMYIIIVISVLMIVVLITCLICAFYWWTREFVAFGGRRWSLADCRGRRKKMMVQNNEGSESKQHFIRYDDFGGRTRVCKLWIKYWKEHVTTMRY
ncbi:uncharacterized protein LOC116267202 [Nymphaea colorata]|nr:uncharacterized protein LOC116267202 [Nymphaea colorata]